MTDLHVVVCIRFDHRADSEGLRKFKDCIGACPHVEAVMEVAGTYDMIVQARFASLLEYGERMEDIAQQLAEFALTVEANFVGRKRERVDQCRFLLVPCPDGHRRIDVSMINKVVAEGDYMRLCLDGSECLVHQTIRQLALQLDPDQFVQLHRSAIVRIDFVERIIHRQRRWIARLSDGTEQMIAKSHVAEVMRIMSRDLANHRPDPANNGAPQRNDWAIGRILHEAPARMS